jgi:predicted component of type VI protein secretion system
MEITIGRDDALAGACLTLDRYVSRRHAQLREDSGSLVLTDLASRNGTKLDGRVVTDDTPNCTGGSLYRGPYAVAGEAGLGRELARNAGRSHPGVGPGHCADPSAPGGIRPDDGRAARRAPRARRPRQGRKRLDVVASIFVNPLQFGVGEDFARYPRGFERDAANCSRSAASICSTHLRPSACIRPALQRSIDVGSLGAQNRRGAPAGPLCRRRHRRREAAARARADVALSRPEGRAANGGHSARCCATSTWRPIRSWWRRRYARPTASRSRAATCYLSDRGARRGSVTVSARCARWPMPFWAASAIPRLAPARGLERYSSRR